jgi:hypothetical protein
MMDVDFQHVLDLPEPPPAWPWRAGRWLRDRWRRPALRYLALGIVLGVVADRGWQAYRGDGTYERDWCSWIDTKTGERQEGAWPNAEHSFRDVDVYHDRFERGTNRVVYRRFAHLGHKGMFEGDARSAEGPMSEGGRVHGHWVQTTWEPYSQTHVWYWYGEEVGEGGFHLRENRGQR